MNELVFKRNDQVVTSSRNIARDFEKTHKHVLKTIDNMLDNGTLSNTEVKATTYVHEQNKQEYRHFLLTDIAYKKMKNYFSLRKKHTPSNSIYILKHKGFDGYYKIGRTSNIKNRIKAYETASPLGIDIILLYETDKASLLEVIIHKDLQEKRCNGEWFQLNDKKLNAVISLIKNEVKNYESISV